MASLRLLLRADGILDRSYGAYRASHIALSTSRLAAADHVPQSAQRRAAVRFGGDARVPIEAGVLVADGVVRSASTMSAASGHSHQVVETEQQLVGVLLASIGDEGREVIAQLVPLTCGAQLRLLADDMSGGSDQEVRAG